MEFLRRPCQQRRLFVYFGSRRAVRGRALQTPGVFPATGGLLSTSPGSQGLAPAPGRPLSGMAGPEPLPGRQGGGRSALGSSTRHSARPTEGTKCSLPIIRCQARILFGEMPGEGWERAPPPKSMSSQASGCDLFGSRVCETHLGKDLQRKPSWR
uniref:Uncharacterized protein n=1 Tax=Myotis myotis TaxID=51298 RepID=A0A7J7XH28_MYOMY|nr:hypothetical protein mMyoMyo1_011600 [Myotis myotis]